MRKGREVLICALSVTISGRHLLIDIKESEWG